MTQDPKTLADVAKIIDADSALPASRRKAVATHLRTFARVQGKPLEALPADLAAYRTFLKNFHPETAGFGKRHWENVMSSFTFALQHCGLRVLPGRSHAAMAPAWQELYNRLPDKYSRSALSRFMRYCSVADIDPDAVTDAVLDEFMRVLVEESLAKEPARPHRLTIKAWNTALDSIDDWPQVALTVPDNRNRQTLDWADFPESLVSEVEAYLATRSDPDPFDEFGPRAALSPHTIRGQRYQLQCYFSALVNTGSDPEDLRHLADLLDPETVIRALRHLLDHYKKKKTVYRIAQVLRVIARDFLRLDGKCIDELTNIGRKIIPEAAGMTDKNRERLRQLDDPKNVRLLLDLPQRLVRKAKKLDRGRRDDALLVQLALAIEILLMAPLRRQNLAGIQIDRHLQWSRAGHEGVVHLVIPGEEVKNGQQLEFELPSDAEKLLALYLDEYRPRLAMPDNPWLFPGRSDGNKVAAVLGKQISDVVFAEIGLKIHPHLFRHIAAKLFLDHNPGQYEVVRRVLGHSSMQTTVTFYAGAEGATAARHFDNSILKLRGDSMNALTEDPR